MRQLRHQDPGAHPDVLGQLRMGRMGRMDRRLGVHERRGLWVRRRRHGLAVHQLRDLRHPAAGAHADVQRQLPVGWLRILVQRGQLQRLGGVQPGQRQRRAPERLLRAVRHQVSAAESELLEQLPMGRMGRMVRHVELQQPGPV